MKVSIIIRARNEERWIPFCLRSVFSQSYKDFEVILVDNNSTDNTITKAKQFDVKILKVDNYRPGKALNFAARASHGEFLVSLSAHCIPKDKDWLYSLLCNFDSQEIAGVYGRQEPMNQTDDLDKRDLWIAFGLDKRTQVKDSFFHNANSMIRRSVWEKIPFDENATNIEDRLWAKQIIGKGYKIIYEPRASVYHYHGIHQSADRERCRDVVSIMEAIEPISKEEKDLIESMNIVAVVPVKGEAQHLCGRPLIEYTLERARQSRFIDRIVVSTDSPDIAEISKRFGVDVPFMRGPDLSQPEVGIEEVLKYSLEKLEEAGELVDLVVHLGVHGPFRPPSLIDDLIELLFHNGFDSALPGCRTYNSCWLRTESGFQRVDEGFISRKIKKPVYIGYPALAVITYPEFIREGRLLGERVGIYEISDVFSTIQIGSKREEELAERVLGGWWEEQKNGYPDINTSKKWLHSNKK